MLQILHRILHALKKRGKHGLVVRHIPTCVFEEEPIITESQHLPFHGVMIILESCAQVIAP